MAEEIGVPVESDVASQFTIMGRPVVFVDGKEYEPFESQVSFSPADEVNIGTKLNTNQLKIKYRDPETDLDLTESACMKWILISTGHMVDMSSKNCKLCQYYIRCVEGCPVWIYTRLKSCLGIGWREYCNVETSKFSYIVFEGLMDVRDSLIDEIENFKESKSDV